MSGQCPDIESRKNKSTDSERYTYAVIEIFGSVFYFNTTNRNLDFFLMLVSIYPSKYQYLVCVPCNRIPNRVKFLKIPRKRDKTHQTLSKMVLKSITQTTIKKRHGLDRMRHRSDCFWWGFSIHVRTSPDISGQISGHLRTSPDISRPGTKILPNTAKTVSHSIKTVLHFSVCISNGSYNHFWKCSACFKIFTRYF
mgnify:CR=1 FL=1